MEPPPSSDDGSTGLEPETYHRGRKPFSGVIAGLAVIAAAGWTFLRWRPSRVRIEGASMAPTLLPGDWALVVVPSRYERRDVVVVEHPDRPGYEMVKRLLGSPGDRVGDRSMGLDEFWVEGDLASASTDSRQFGPVRSSNLKARVLLIYLPKHRRGRVR